MTLLDITLTDLLQASRNKTIFFFMLVVPIGIALLFMLIFGGVGDDSGFELPAVDVVIVNLDQGQMPEQFAAGAIEALAVGSPDQAGFDSMGGLMVEAMVSGAKFTFKPVEQP